jgi:hypothetical protein
MTRRPPKSVTRPPASSIRTSGAARSQGVARALLDGTVAYARAESAIGLEAYPIDPHGERVHVAFAYVGTTSMFEAAGFRLVLETASRSAGRPRWLMRLDLEETR